VTRALLDRFLREIDTSLAYIRPSSILDVGCGEGVVTSRMARLTGVTTVGVDLGVPALEAEWRQREGGLLSFEAALTYELPFDDGSFDCVCALEVLEHLERPRDALAELTRVSARMLILSVPREPIWRLAHMVAGRDLRALGNTPGHINHWSSRAFRQLLARYGTVRRLARPFPWTVIVLERSR